MHEVCHCLQSNSLPHIYLCILDPWLTACRVFLKEYFIVGTILRISNIYLPITKVDTSFNIIQYFQQHLMFFLLEFVQWAMFDKAVFIQLLDVPLKTPPLQGPTVLSIVKQLLMYMTQIRRFQSYTLKWCIHLL